MQDLHLQWFETGNLHNRTATVTTGGVTYNPSETFGYDLHNRLLSSQVTNAQGIQTAVSYAYDSVGDITCKSDVVGHACTTTSTDYSYGQGAGPHALTGVAGVNYGYDANGNMQLRNGSSLSWNDDNLPTYIASTGTVNGNNTVTGSSTFSYGPDLQRYQQVTTDSVAGNSTTTYIGGLFEVYSISGTTQYRHNIMASGGVVAVHTLDQSGNASTSYIHSDHLGSSDTLTGDTGAVTQQMSFDAFGLRRDAATWAYDLTGTQISLLKGKTDRGFTSQEQLDSVGLVHMNGRVYDPTIARFISADVTIPAWKESQAFNRYAYVYNNPLKYIDPTGYIPDDDISVYNWSHPGHPFYDPELSKAAANGVLTGLIVGSFFVGIGELVGPEAAAAALAQTSATAQRLVGWGFTFTYMGLTTGAIFELLHTDTPFVFTYMSDADLLKLLSLAILDKDAKAAARIAAEAAKRGLLKTQTTPAPTPPGSNPGGGGDRGGSNDGNRGATELHISWERHITHCVLWQSDGNRNFWVCTTSP